MNGYVTNVGDYQVNKLAWPKGLGEIHERLAAHGLELGFHILSSGTSVCMDQMLGPDQPGQPPVCNMTITRLDVQLEIKKE